MATILVIDDNAINRKYLHALLEFEKHTILEAADGAIGLDIVKQQPVDLIITDIVMPNMNGYDFVKNIKLIPKLADIPIIFYSATYKVPDVSYIAVQLGVKSVLSKPSEPEIIINAVNRALRTTENKHFNAQKKDVEKDTSLSLGGRLSALLELINNLSGLKDRKNLLENFCKASRGIEAVKFFIVGLLNEDKHSFAHYLTSSNDKIIEVTTKIPPQENSFIKKLLTHKTPIKIHLNEKPNIYLPTDHPISQGLLGLPITHLDKTLGFLYFADKLDGSAFTDIDVEIATFLATEFATLYYNLPQAANVASSNQ